MVDASERLQHLLSIIPLFADAECVSLAEVQRRAGVDASTVLEDLRAITDRVNDPAGFVETVGIEFEHDRVSLRSSHFLRPMRITIPELCALELGLAMLGAATPPDARVPIDRARLRLRQAIVSMPAPARQELWQAPAPPSADGEIISQARAAAIHSTKVRILYRGANDTEPAERVIHPYALAPSHGTWYVIAHCEQSEGLRFFRVDRIEQIAPLDETFVRAADSLAVDGLLENGKPFHGTPPAKLVIHYSPHIARWIAEREGKDLASDGSLTIEHPLADEGWAVRHVLQYGPDAEVIAPASVRDEVRRALERIIASS